ncbi:MAG: hypothetical protein AAF762_00180 [Pseudomonadota bacterium]
MRLAEYRKAFAAGITGIVGVAALFVPGVADMLSEEVVMAIATVAATVVVYAVPNDPPKPKGKS